MIAHVRGGEDGRYLQGNCFFFFFLLTGIYVYQYIVIILTSVLSSKLYYLELGTVEYIVIDIMY